jgi:hypothetical protein
MRMLVIGGLAYYLWLLLAALFLVLGWWLFRNKSQTWQMRLLFGMTVFAWVVHFSRYWLDPDLRTYTLFFEDLCGFNTMLYPFLFLSKNKVSKDIMFFVGMVFASHSLFYPNNIDGDPIWYFNTIRFFLAHFILVAVPLWMVLWGRHVPSWRNIPYMIVYVLIGALYSFSLSVFLKELGFVSYYKNYMGLWGNERSVYRIFEAVAPMFRYTDVVGGVEVSKPIPYVYMIPGLILFYVPVWTLMSLPFWRKQPSDLT